MPAMCKGVVGRITGNSRGGSWDFINDIRMFSIPEFTTPHGTVITSGIVHLDDITEEGMKQLLEYESQLKDEGEALYNGKYEESWK